MSWNESKIYKNNLPRTSVVESLRRSGHSTCMQFCVSVFSRIVSFRNPKEPYPTPLALLTMSHPGLRAAGGITKKRKDKDKKVRKLAFFIKHIARPSSVT